MGRAFFYLLFLTLLCSFVNSNAEVFVTSLSGKDLPSIEDDFRPLFTPPPPPSNNDPCSAEVLNVNSTCVPTQGTTVDAGNSTVATPTCGQWSYSGGDVWYSVLVPASGFLKITLSSTSIMDGGIALYSGVDCNTVTEVVCNDFWQLPSTIMLTPANGLQGETVWVRVWEGQNDSPGPFEICAVEEEMFYADTLTYTPQELIEDILVTGCLEAFNVEYTGTQGALGFFDAGAGSPFDFSTGIILTTGDATISMGENDSPSAGAQNEDWNNPATDPDLEELSGFDVHDAAILEFDFIPSSDTVKFKYIFASEEYDEYVCGTVNDVFGFFISGPGITGTYEGGAINVALIPGTNIPVSINTVNNGTVGMSGDASNCDGGSDYYLGNTEYFQNDPFTSIMQYDGYTVSLEAIAVLQACETYHIKLKIGDGGDASFDSAVMFEAGSFSSGGTAQMNNISNVGTQVDIYEGCTNYYVFTRIDTSEQAMQDTVNVVLDVGGTAIEGIDYTDVPDTLLILPGQLTDTLYYTAFFDNIDEGDEYIIFSLLSGCFCTPESLSDTIWIKNNYYFEGAITDPPMICIGGAAALQADINPNLDPLLISYQWSTLEPTSNIVVSPPTTTNYQVTITNVCVTDTVMTTSVNVIPEIDATFTLSTDTACVGEPVVITYVGQSTTSASYDWQFEDATPSNAASEGPHSLVWNTIGLKNIQLNIDDQGCTADASLQIYIKEYNSLSLSTTSSDLNCFNVCDGVGSVTANSGVSPFSYLWEDGRTTQTVNQLCPASYSVTVFDAYGCKDTTHITVTAPSDIIYQVTTDSTSCYEYNDGQASVNVSGGTPPYSYDWSNQITDNTNINLYAGIYSLTITDANGCAKIEDAVEIKEPSQVNASIYGEHYENGEIWICMGNQEILSTSITGGTGPYNCLWNTGSNAHVIEVIPNVTSVYTLNVTDRKGCVSPEVAIDVNVYDPITIETQANPQEICSGDPVTVDVTVTGGSGNYTYELFSNAGMTEESNHFLIYPNQTQEYVMQVRDHCGSPFEKDTFEISVNENPELIFFADQTTGCSPLEVRFINNSSGEGNTYVWEFARGDSYSSVAFGENPSHTFELSHSYNVTLRATTPGNCTSQLTKYNYIRVFPNPVAKFEAEPSVASVIKPSVLFNNQSEGADTYVWNFDDSQTSNAHSPYHRYSNLAADYYVQLIARNRYGCMDSVEQKIQIQDHVSLYVPTAFTPDCDGYNDFFIAKGNGILKEGYKMLVYDRWGMLIFESDDIDKGWNGKTAGGAFGKAGIYTWLIVFTDVNKVVHQRSGKINLIK